MPCRRFVPGRANARLTIVDVFDYVAVRREETALPPRHEGRGLHVATLMTSRGEHRSLRRAPATTVGRRRQWPAPGGLVRPGPASRWCHRQPVLAQLVASQPVTYRSSRTS